tara:strand:- start:587 stop:853 length:267 start_codon:yes stop_codon:yes gene_type:complete
LGLKKYFSGKSRVSISGNNKDSLARLGDSEVAAVKHSPCHAIPEVGQRLNNDSEVSPFVGREETWYVFDNDNRGAAALNKCCVVVEES